MPFHTHRILNVKETAIADAIDGFIIGVSASILLRNKKPSTIETIFLGGTLGAITCGVGGYFLAKYQNKQTEVLGR